MAGTVTSSLSRIGNAQPGMPALYCITANCTGDASDGSFPATVLARTGADLANTDGLFLAQVITNPGATTPTDGWDLAITDANGLDLLGGSGGDRDDADSQVAFPTISARPCFGDLILAITNNSVNSAVIVIQVYLTTHPTPGVQPVA